MLKIVRVFVGVFVLCILLVGYGLSEPEEHKTIYVKQSDANDFHLSVLYKVDKAADFPADCPIAYGFTELDTRKLSFTSLFRYPYRPWMLFSPPIPDDTPLPPEENVTVTYGYPWNSYPFAKDIGTCALLAIYFQDKSDLVRIVEHIPAISHINWGRYYFLLINEDPVSWNEEFVEDILLNSTVTSIMKYKLFPVGKQNGLELYTACFYCNGGYSKVVSLGLLPHSRQKLLDMKTLYPDFTTNMNNTFLSGVFVEEFSKVDAKKILQSTENYFIGIAFLDLISDALNFNFSVYVIDIGLSGAFNRRMDDGMWVGLAGDVLYGKADFALGTVPIAELLGFISYSVPLANTRFLIFASKPKTFFSPWTVVKAFGIGIWIAIFIAVSIAAIVFGYSLEKEMSKYSTLRRYSYAFHFILLSAVGCPLSMPIRMASRLLVSFWLLSCIIISFSYQSNLASIMTIPSKVEVPSTYEEILEMNYKYGGSSLTNAFFQYLTSESETPHIAEIRDNIINFDTIKECYEVSLKSRLVCITVPEIGVSELYSFLDENYMPQLDPKLQSGITASGCSILRKGFVGFDHYNWAIHNRIEAGLFQFWEQDNLKRNFLEGIRKKRSNQKIIDSDASYHVKWNQLNLRQVSAPFIILFFGILFAILILVLEVASNLVK